MLEKLISKEMTSALAEVVKNKVEGRRTAAHSTLTKEAGDAFKAAYRDLQSFLEGIAKNLPLEENNLSEDMGNWISSGWVFPHLWGAIYPSDGGKISGEVPQLFVIRKPEVLRWGISMSTKAHANQVACASISEFLEKHEGLYVFFERGFTLENESSVDGHDKPTSLVKNVKVTSMNQPGNLAHDIQKDLMDLFPHFLALVEQFRSQSLIVDPDHDEDSVDSASGSESEDSKVENGVNYWTIAPGEGTRLWNDCLKNEIICVGWDDIGDLTPYQTHEMMKERYAKVRSQADSARNTIRALFDFAHTIKSGDVIFAKDGRQKIVGYGEVISDYLFDASRKEYKHIRKVKWLKSGNWSLDSNERMAVKAVTNITRHAGLVEKILSMINGKVSVPEVEVESGEPYSVEDALKDVFLSKDEFAEISEALRTKQNIILQGPPGVGKTFIAERLAYAMIGSRTKSCVEFVQFHPSYSYEDFVQGYRPAGGTFEMRNGVFMEICERARQSSEKPFVLVIDEINRGNLSKIFGELLMLIESDKRGKKIKLTYSKAGERFSVPSNLHIIGTMNTADRSLTMIDYALRRRFSFFDVKPAFESVQFKGRMAELGLKEQDIAFLTKQLKALNNRIADDTKYLGPGFEIGHSYFCNKSQGEQFNPWFLKILKHEIAPLLREYWFDDRERAEKEIAALKAS